VAQPASEPAEIAAPTTPAAPAGKKAPVKKAPKTAPKAVPKAAPKAAPKKAQKSAPPAKGPKAAVEIKVPRVAALKTKACTDEQIFVWELIHLMRMGKVVFVGHTKVPHTEIRGFDDRAKAFIATHIKIAPKGAYVQPAEVDAILAFVKPYVPKEMAGKKWGKALFPQE
jgi:hypothetical protein